MTRYAPQWLQSGTYAASLDRRLIGALWPSPASSGCAVTAAGTGMDVHIDPGQVAVPSPNNTGTVLCTSDAIETVTLAPAPPAGTDRVDLIVCQPRSMELDGVSTQEDFIFAVVAGAEGAPPGTRPFTPAGTVALADVHVAGGSASVVAANVTDLRPASLAIPDRAPAFDTVHLYVGHGVQSIPSAVWTTVTVWNPPLENLGGGSFAAGVYTVPADGWYLVNAMLLWAALPNSVVASYQQQFRLGAGSGGAAGAGSNGQVFLSPYCGGNLSAGISAMQRYLHKGNTVEAQLYNGHTAAHSTFGGYGWLDVLRVA